MIYLILINNNTKPTKKLQYARKEKIDQIPWSTSYIIPNVRPYCPLAETVPPTNDNHDMMM